MMRMRLLCRLMILNMVRLVMFIFVIRFVCIVRLSGRILERRVRMLVLLLMWLCCLGVGSSLDPVVRAELRVLRSIRR